MHGRSESTSSVAFEVLIIKFLLTLKLKINVKFLFSEKHKRTDVHGLASLVSDVILEYTKIRIPNKRYQTYTVRTF